MHERDGKPVFEAGVLWRLVLLTTLLPVAAGCAGLTDKGYWGANAGWPDGQRLARSVVEAARSPHTWAPLTGALVFGVTGLDEEVSDWAIRKQPLFGRDAADSSDVLRQVAAAGYLASALAVPSDGMGSRAKGLLVGFTTITLDRVTVDGLKRLTSRQRPDGSNDRGFPSGHASLAATFSTMAVGNLAYAEMAEGWRTTASVGLYGVAAATGWARVEAGKHYPSDVLAGYALGHFLSRFTYHAFLEGGGVEQRLGLVVEPLPGGGRLTLRLALYPTGR